MFDEDTIVKAICSRATIHASRPKAFVALGPEFFNTEILGTFAKIVVRSKTPRLLVFTARSQRKLQGFRNMVT